MKTNKKVIKKKYSRKQNTYIFLAFRYALGRMTPAPYEMSDYIREDIEGIGNFYIKKMIDEIENAIELGHAGWDCDVKTWKDLSIFLQKELEKRNENK